MVFFRAWESTIKEVETGVLETEARILKSPMSQHPSLITDSDQSCLQQARHNSLPSSDNVSWGTGGDCSALASRPSIYCKPHYFCLKIKSQQKTEKNDIICSISFWEALERFIQVFRRDFKIMWGLLTLSDFSLHTHTRINTHINTHPYKNTHMDSLLHLSSKVRV